MRSRKAPTYSHRKNPDQLRAKPTQKHPKTNRKHLDTLTKARIKTLDHYYSQRDIQKILKQEDGLDVSQRTIGRTINDESSRRRGNCPEKPETRSRKPKFSEAQLDSVEEVLDTHPDIKSMSWNEIASASEIGDLMGDWEWQKLRDAMTRRGRGRFIMVQKDEVPESVAKKRV